MAKRIEKLDNERWKGWDWAASNKLNEVIEAVNILELIVDSLNTMPDGSKHTLVMKDPTQAEPDKELTISKTLTADTGEKWETVGWTERVSPEIADRLVIRQVEPSEPDAEQDEGIYDLLNEWDAGDMTVAMFAEKIRNLLKGQS